MPRKVDTYTFQGEVWSLRPATEPYAIALPLQGEGWSIRPAAEPNAIVLRLRRRDSVRAGAGLDFDRHVRQRGQI